MPPALPMYRRSSFFCIVLAFVVALGACSPTPDKAQLTVPDLGGATPWTDLAVEDGDDVFHFVVVSDRTGSARPGVFAGAMPTVNLLAPAFVVSVGDLIEGYTESPAQLDQEWDEIESYVAKLDAPFFYAAGNHDMSNAVMAEAWRTRFGPSYYHFIYKGVLFVVLNSELFGMVGQADTPLPGPWRQSDQMNFVRSVLAQHHEARWTIVLLHQPLWDAPEVHPDWLAIEEALGARPYTVFAGHLHRYSLARRHDRNFITLATTGGGSPLRGSALGEFDQVAWVTMRPDGPVIANIEIDGVHDETVSTPAMRETLDALAAGIVVESVVNDGELFSGMAQKVAIHNPTEHVVTASPRVVRRGNLTVDGLVPVTIAPGERAELFVQLQVSDPTPYRDLVAAGVEWTLTTTLDERVVQLPVRKALLPLTRHDIVPTQPITVDGDLSEWGELRFNATSQGDIASPEHPTDDISFRFDVRESATHLNIAVAVVDDDIQYRPNLVARNQDALAIYIDPREATARDRNMSAGEAVVGGDMAQLVGTIIATGTTVPDDLLEFMAESEAEIEHTVQMTDTGYNLELTVPLAYLAAKAAGGQDWRVARIAISAFDLDAGTHAPKSLHWQPFRYGEAPLRGTHLFRRPL